MNDICFLIDKTPLPVILHEQGKIIHVNSGFTNMISQKENPAELDFLKWLATVIKNSEHIQLLLQEMTKNKEIKFNTEAYVKGSLHHWAIFSFPMTNSKENHRITYLKNIDISQGVKSYWDLHLRANKATMELIQEITQRKKMEQKAAKLSQELIVASRQAGMADVSASMIHNIGNILTSVSVSLGFVKESLESALYTKASMIKGLLAANKEHLIDYFINDEKGKLIPDYLIDLLEKITEQNILLKNETGVLLDAYEYMKEIILAQNELARPMAVIEKVSVCESIDAAINMIMSKNSLMSKQITINKDYSFRNAIFVDRSYLTQILINLLKNAKEALLEATDNNNKIITIKLLAGEKPGYMEIQVIDNGIGIAAENLANIFMFGYSTKKKGHGIGLHNCLLMVKELGGSLTVKSEGIGKGAQFILSLPINKTQRMDQNG